MSKKFIPVFSIILLLVSLVAPGIQPVAAEEKEEKVFEDGEYDITAKALNTDSDEASGAAGFIKEDAKLMIENGQIKLAITIPNNDMAEIKGMQIEGKAPEKEEKDDSVVYTYVLNELQEELSAQVQYEVPSLNMEHDVPFRFELEGLDNLPLKEEDDGSEGTDKDNSEGTDEDQAEDNDESEGSDKDESDDKEEDKGEETDKDKPEEDEISLDNLKDGYYTIGVEYLKSDDDDTSSMGNYLSDEVFVAVKDGKPELTVTVEEDETVTKLEIADKTAHKKEIDGEKRYETFNVTKLDSTLTAYVEYQAPFQGSVFEGNADFRVAFDESTIKKVKASDKPTGEEIEEEPETSGGSNNSQGEPESSDEFKLGYTFFEKGKNKESTMNNFKKGSANITEDKHGNYLVSMAFNSGDMIEYLEIDNKRAKVVKEYKGKNGIVKVFEFEVKNLKKKHAGKVKVNVPGMYNTAHEVDLVFDEIGTIPKPSPENPTPADPNPGQSVDSEGDNGDGKGEIKNTKVVDFDFAEMKYTFYKSGTMEKSIMDDFAKGLAIVRTHKKNGKEYATLTFSSPEMIKYIKVNGVDAHVIKQTKNELVVDFPVENINKKQSIKAFIEVPGMYATEHAVDLVFDTGSVKSLAIDDIPSYLKKHIETSGSPALPTNEGNGKGSGTPAEGGPDFDRDEDGNIIGSNKDNNSGINPKTADLNMQQVMMFGSLLLLSLIPLAIKMRRKFMAAK